MGKKYIDANKLEEMVIQSKKDNPHSNSIQRQMHTHEHRHFLCMINQLPLADVVAVVRCEDCEFYTQFKKIEDFDGQCSIHCIQIDKEFYCQYGKKKTSFDERNGGQ